MMTLDCDFRESEPHVEYCKSVDKFDVGKDVVRHVRELSSPTQLFANFDRQVIRETDDFAAIFRQPRNGISHLPRKQCTSAPLLQHVDNELSIETTLRLHFEGLIEALQPPAAWQSEGVTSPSMQCRTTARNVVMKLLVKHRLIPHKVVPTKLGGILVSYKRSKNSHVLDVEIDDESDVVAVVSNPNRVLCSGHLEDSGFTSEVIQRFSG